MQDRNGRRLLKKSELIDMLQLEEAEVDWLINTSQIRPVRICGQERFDTKDVLQLIDSYKITQGRSDYAQPEQEATTFKSGTGSPLS